LVNSNGALVGMNTLKVVDRSDNRVEGMGYAIPSNIVAKTADAIITEGIEQVPYLGVEADALVITSELMSFYGFPSRGIYARKVTPNTTAAAVEMKAADIITEINGSKVLTLEDLEKAVSGINIDGEITVTVQRPTTVGFSAFARTTWEEVKLTGKMKGFPIGVYF
jgi:S1-C subfamily serine protease